ncbi:MAG: ClpXP protease specificity-enhancing factor [Proteobacteria bacterium]|nr:MAG: ClpXP protease specificity-enhancing factor [Pseudomonadota bacterium]
MDIETLSETDDSDLPSKRPYMLRALWEWCSDAGLTPQILVDARFDGVTVPTEFVKDGAIVLNIHDRAVRDLQMDNEAVSFSARFAGQVRSVYVPMGAVLAIYARENGQGLFFEVPGHEAPAEGESSAPVDGDAPGAGSSAPPRGKPDLKIV